MRARGERLAQRIRAAGLKVTGPRLAILEQLERDVSHPTAEEVLAVLRKEHPSLSLSTVYKTLEAFLGAGLCHRVVGDGVRLRVDGVTEPHDHAVCRSCGRIFDVDRVLYPLPPPPTRLPDGLSVTGMRIQYDVECSDCGDRGPAARHPSKDHDEKSHKEVNHG